MTQPPEYAISVPSTPAIHNEPPRAYQWQQMSQDQLKILRGKMIEMVLQVVTQALRGLFIPSPSLQDSFDQLKDWADFLLDGDSPLDADKLFGFLKQWQLPPIHIGRITDILPGLVVDSGFDVAPAETSGRWFRDNTVGRTSLGSAAIVGNGEADQLIAVPVMVAAGQEYEPLAWVSWEDATSSADGLQLLVFEFLGEDYVGTEVIAETTPTGTASWTQMQGSYTVPSGVDRVSMAIGVTSGFTDGTVWVDDMAGPSTGLLKISWTKNLPELFGVVDTDLDGDIDFADVWNTLWDTGLKPLEWIPIVSQNTIDRIYNAWANLGSMVDLDRPQTDVLDSVTGLLNAILGSQAQVAAVEARVRAIESGAAIITDDFARTASLDLGTNYTVRNVSGAGAGSIGTDGKGNAVWFASGAGSRVQYVRRNDATVPTDGFLFRIVISSNPQSYIFDDAYTYFMARMNTSADTAIRLRLGYGTAQLQAVVSDVVTNLGSSATIPIGMAGKTLEWQGGEPGGVNLRHFSVWLDSALIIDGTDSAPVSQVGASYRSIALGMETGNRLIITQNIPSGCAFYSVAEVA